MVPDSFHKLGTPDYMLHRKDLQNILSNALAEQGIKLDSKRLDELLILFLEGEYLINQTKQPITDQIQRLAKEFIVSPSAKEILKLT